MSLPVQANPQMMVSSGYKIPLTLRFRSSASAYLSRTFAAAPVVRTKQTFSCWFKRGQLGVAARLFDCYDGTSTWSTALYFNTNDTLELDFGGISQYNIVTNQVFRDPSAWYHLVISIDTTQSTAANRVIWYLNGTQITSFSTANYPAQNSPSQWTINTANNKIMAQWSSVAFLDGYLGEVNFIDGQALNQFYFGAYDSNGIWQPLAYSGNYGTNGFYLNFRNTASTTTLGNDTSGNGNNWTPNNISLTAGTTYDSMTDSPTVSSTSVSNYAVYNAIAGDKNISASGGSITNGNMYVTAGGGASDGLVATGTISCLNGTYYSETTCVAAGSAGSQTTYVCVNQIGSGAAVYFAYEKGGQHYDPTNGWVAGWSAWTTGDVIGVAVDQTTATARATFYKNNVLQGTLTYSTTVPLTFAARPQYNASFALNCGQQPLVYTPPTGFSTLNTYNLTTSIISNGAAFMAASLYTGTGAPLTVNNGINTAIGTSFPTEFLWLKNRSLGAGGNHVVFDVVRGGPSNELYPNLTNAEAANTGALASLNSNGFTLSNGGDLVRYNSNTNAYVAWQWKAGGTGITNTSGSLTSTTSANPTAGFSVVTFTTQASGIATVGHGLNFAPSFIITKTRGVPAGWVTYHASVGNTGYLYLNSTSAFNTDSTIWNNTSPSSTVFTLGSGYAGSYSYVAYCWAPIAGYSAFGSYTGNGSTDGPFIYLGFRPRWIMVKRTDSTGNWQMLDTSRLGYNSSNYSLFANLTNAEQYNVVTDILSNGLKIRDTATDVNASGGTYIYAAFAENPFALARAR